MNKSRIRIITGDITKVETDAIVNAANRRLLGGGGVDGAIHRAAGPELLEECSTLNGCETGQAKITKAYRLPAKYVIHTVGPIWSDGHNHEEDLLRSCYETSLNLAIQYKCRTIAFPNISTGIYGFPKEPAAQIALSTVKQFLERNKEIEEVVFVCFDEENYRLYSELAGK
ncbi:MAG: O-acetyl-ADP-ribose deacetylase [Bacteroidetes bacterium]|nr:O-acetyl-ADP-ribose deacetylase [Bacteroidota bacterium]